MEEKRELALSFKVDEEFQTWSASSRKDFCSLTDNYIIRIKIQRHFSLYIFCIKICVLDFPSRSLPIMGEIIIVLSSRLLMEGIHRQNTASSSHLTSIQQLQQSYRIEHFWLASENPLAWN